MALMLSSCLFSPGKFDARLDIRRDGGFSFAYTGEISLIGLSRMSELFLEESAEEEFVPICFLEFPEGEAGDADAAGDVEPEAVPARNDRKSGKALELDGAASVPAPILDEDYLDYAYEERTCTDDEIAEQKEEWEKSQAEARAEAAQIRELIQTLLGGIDPSHPDAAQEVAKRLARQSGWNRVEYLGEGLYSVDFAIQSRLSHDFSFPSLEGFSMPGNFVQANLRDGGTVRIEAPGFSNSSLLNNPMTRSVGAMAAAEIAQMRGDTTRPLVPELEGSFTITTNAEILANNTDEGPEEVAEGRRLTWTITRRTLIAPSALIRIGQ